MSNGEQLNNGRKTPCHGLQALFYGPDIDGRTEGDREEREAKAKSICATCPLRLSCLERSLVWESMHGVHGSWGVWGGMSEGDRKRFRRHLRAEGYTSVPSGLDLLASLRSFTNSDIRRKLRRA